MNDSIAYSVTAGAHLERRPKPMNKNAYWQIFQEGKVRGRAR
jgi:hypothetical protein